MANDAREHYRSGHRLYGQKEWDGAIAEYEKALALEPDWSDCIQALGMAQMQKGELEAALASLLRATELAPKDHFAFTSLSMVYQRLDRIQEAEDAQAKARMLAWQEDVGSGPGAP